MSESIRSLAVSLAVSLIETWCRTFGHATPVCANPGAVLVAFLRKQWAPMRRDVAVKCLKIDHFDFPDCTHFERKKADK